MRRSLFILIPALLLAGCATMVNRTYQKVTFNTPGVTGADCTIITPGNTYRVITPGIGQIERAHETLSIRCHKATYYDATMEVKPHMTGHIMLNVFNGIVPGTALDMGTHADYTYPAIINIVMQPNPEAVATAKPEGEPAAEPLPRKPLPDSVPEPDEKPADETIRRALRK